MEEQKARGSSKVWARVFDSDAPTQEELTRSLAAAGESYKVLRWWPHWMFRSAMRARWSRIFSASTAKSCKSRWMRFRMAFPTSKGS
jgi:hypothetical protein